FRIVSPGSGLDDLLQIKTDFQQLIEQGQADPLFAVQLLAELLVGPLGVADEAVEVRLQGVACLGERLLEQLMLAVVHLAKSNDLLTEAVDRRRADRMVGLNASPLSPAPLPRRERGRGD